MNKIKFLAAFLSLSLVLSACGGAASSDENVAHDHATETEVTTEFVTETDVAEVFATEMVDNTDATEKLDTEIATEVDVAENDTEKTSNKKEDTKKEDDTSSKNPSTGSNNSSSNNSGNNTGNTGSGTNTGNNGSGSSKPDTEKDTEKPVTTPDTEKPEKGPEEAESTEKPAPDTEKPVEDTECKHDGGVWYSGYDGKHDVNCKKCDVTLYTERCSYVKGNSCCTKCSVLCNHPNQDRSSDESRNGVCGWTCEDCGCTNYKEHTIHNDECTRCGRVFPCLHEFTYAEWHGSLTEHVIECENCGENMGTESHSFVNGVCACGCPEPAPEPEPPTEAPIIETEVPVVETEVPAPVVEEPVVPETPVEDGVTSVDVVHVWKHICRHH